MTKTRELHEKAMVFYEKAFFAKRGGNTAFAQELLREALKLENQAAEVLRDKTDSDNARSIILRSIALIEKELSVKYKAKAATANSSKSGGAKGGKRLTQTEIINHLADKSGMKRAAAKEFLNELANLAISEVKRTGEFMMPGLGIIVLSKRKAREGRNPATGAKITIPAKTTLKFRPVKTLEENKII